MSWIRRRPLAALVVLALALRVACAVVTEYKPIFPAYYYTDATLTHDYALSALKDIREGRAPLINGTLGERVQTLTSLEIYRMLGPRPFALKLLNALLGALAVAAFAWAMSIIFPTRAALIAGLALAVWPSHIFYTSQNLKEAPIGLLTYAAFGAVFAAGFGEGVSRARAASLAAAAGFALLGAGFYRSYVLVAAGGTLLAALALSALRPPRTNALLAAAALVAALAFYPAASGRLLAAFDSRALGEADSNWTVSRLIPVTYDNADPRLIYRPTSPEGLSRFRTARQSADRRWALINAHRDIGSQLYPDETFKTWLDVLLYLPKGAFTVLFMPLPGLSPLEGKLGRYAASGENLALLALAALAAAGILRGRKSAARLGLIAFFAVMTVGAALLEFDLGSAGRHKLLYLPMLFPFAAEEALRLLRVKESE